MNSNAHPDDGSTRLSQSDFKPRVLRRYTNNSNRTLYFPLITKQVRPHDKYHDPAARPRDSFYQPKEPFAKNKQAFWATYSTISSYWPAGPRNKGVL